jgi:hypothetical protein
MSDCLLHVHAQHHQHDEAYIVGNRHALEGLRAALDGILVAGLERVKIEMMTADGEGYDLHIVLDPSPWAKGSRWMQRALPYAAEDAKSGPEALWPWEESNIVPIIKIPIPQTEG